MVETKDISIGQDRWIKWVELDPNDNNLFDIDPWLEPTKQFWQNLETECVAACCGIDAFGLWPEDIKSAAQAFNREELVVHLSKLKDEVGQAKNNIVASKRLNNLFDRQVFLQLIDHVLMCI